ncbi:hypothetical protein [Thermofilum pendens]|nr:hypothetical protein [Thermofilum pendens]
MLVELALIVVGLVVTYALSRRRIRARNSVKYRVYGYRIIV